MDRATKYTTNQFSMGVIVKWQARIQNIFTFKINPTLSCFLFDTSTNMWNWMVEGNSIGGWLKNRKVATDRYEVVEKLNAYIHIAHIEFILIWQKNNIICHLTKSSSSVFRICNIQCVSIWFHGRWRFGNAIVFSPNSV